MGLYRKKPVTIEARELTHEDIDDIAAWCNGIITIPTGLIIETLEGDIRASMGDFIIQGVQGEFYPCKPDIFAQTYEEV